MLVERPVCTCGYCDTDLYEGDPFYWIEDEKFCEECAKEWLANKKEYVTR